MACCPRASSFVRHTEGREALAQEHLTVSALSAPCDGSPMTVRGGGVPARTTALMPLCRMGPPPRSSLPMRITASWSGSLARRIQMWHDLFVHLPAAPLGRRHPDHASVPRRARNPQGQGPPYGRRYAPSLTAPVRAGVPHEWVGTKKRGCPGRTKKLEVEIIGWARPGHP